MSAGPAPSFTDKHPDHVGVNFVKHVSGFLFWFFGAAMASFLATTIVIPFIAGPMGRSEAYVRHLGNVVQSERTMAAYVNYCFGMRATDWPIAWAERQVSAYLPAKDGGLFADAKAAEGMERAAEKAKQEQAENHQAPSADQNVKSMSGKVGKWLDDQFYPVQRAFWITFLTRGTYALACGMSFFFILAFAWYIGEHRARMRSLDGHQPMGNRHRWWFRGFEASLVAVPTWCAVPLTGPTVLIFVLAFAFAAFALVGVRTHYVEI